MVEKETIEKEEFEKISEKYPSLPQTLVLKTDLIRRGVAFTDRAFEEIRDPRRYEHASRILFLYHKVQDARRGFEVPMCFAFNDGTHWMIQFGPPESEPYTVDFFDDKFWLYRTRRY